MLSWNCSHCNKSASKCWLYTERQTVRPSVIRLAEEPRAAAMAVQESLAAVRPDQGGNITVLLLETHFLGLEIPKHATGK